jgi:hypothetical protein
MVFCFRRFRLNFAYFYSPHASRPCNHDFLVKLLRNGTEYILWIFSSRSFFMNLLFIVTYIRIFPQPSVLKHPQCIKSTVIWDVSLCSRVEVRQHFGSLPPPSSGSKNNSGKEPARSKQSWFDDFLFGLLFDHEDLVSTSLRNAGKRFQKIRHLIPKDSIIHVDSKWFWRWCITHRITGFLDFFHRLVF